MSTVDCSSRTGDGVPMATARAAPSAWRKKMSWSTLTSAHSAAVLGRQALSLVSLSLSAIYACALVLGTCYIEADDVVSSAELGGEVIINQLFILRQASLSFVRCRSCVVIIRETSAWCVVLVAAQHLYFTALPSFVLKARCRRALTQRPYRAATLKLVSLRHFSVRVALTLY